MYTNFYLSGILFPLFCCVVCLILALSAYFSAIFVLQYARFRFFRHTFQLFLFSSMLDFGFFGILFSYFYSPVCSILAFSAYFSAIFILQYARFWLFRHTFQLFLFSSMLDFGFFGILFSYFCSPVCPALAFSAYF